MLWYQCRCAALRFLQCATVTVNQGNVSQYIWSSPRTQDIHTCWAICMKLKMPIFITLDFRGLHRNLAFQMWNGIHRIWLFCLFVFSRHHSRHMETSPGCKFWLMAIEQWGSCGSCGPCLLWQRTSVYDSPLRGPVTIKSLIVWTTKVCRG